MKLSSIVLLPVILLTACSKPVVQPQPPQKIELVLPTNSITT